MMHELRFHPPEGSLPRSFDDVQAILREADTLAPYVNEDASTPEQLVLTDPDTGVWALLAPAAPAFDDEAESPGEDVLSLQIPYARPRFFGIEGALFALALHQELGYVIEDPQDPRSPQPRVRSEEEMAASWEAQNRAVVEELEQKPTAFDGTLLAQVFSHNLHRRELRLQAGPEVTVPRLLLAVLPARTEPAVLFPYEAGGGLWLPRLATHVLLTRPRKGWLGWKEERVLVEVEALRTLLAPFEQAGAPTGMTAYHPKLEAREAAWSALEGREARGLALVDWNDAIDR